MSKSGGMTNSLSWQPELRMTFIVADEHHAQTFGTNFVQDMVGKALKVRAPEAFVRLVKSERVLSGSVYGGSQFGMEFISEPRGDVVVVGESLLNIAPHQRVIDYFHVARSRSMEDQNSSELIG